jgi:DNA-binding LytR/AlgR family response regulator
MIRCLIIDDEPLARRLLQSYVEQLQNLVCVGLCQSALQAFNVLHTQEVDLMFLDIQMPGIDGLSFLKSLKNPPKVIFTTAFSDYAVEAFELEAEDYLVKPITFERFVKAVQKVVKNSDGAGRQAAKAIVNPYVFLKVNKRMVKINHADIYYAEALGDYVRVHTATQIYTIYFTMNKLAELLPEDRFSRIHRSVIVNLAQIQYMEGNFVRINQIDLPVGITFKERLVEKLTNK